MASFNCELLVILPMLMLMMRTSLRLAALVKASDAPFTSRLSSRNTSAAARQVTQVTVIGNPACRPINSTGAANAPAIAVPWPQPSSAVSTGPVGIPRKVDLGNVTIFSMVRPEEYPWLNAVPRLSWSNSQPVSMTNTFTPAPVDFVHALEIL